MVLDLEDWSEEIFYINGYTIIFNLEDNENFNTDKSFTTIDKNNIEFIIGKNRKLKKKISELEKLL